MPAREKTALAFLAHPDDAEILCAGTLARLGELGWNVHIATATPGDCGSMTEGPEAISARRLIEARAAADVIGATYHCLDERDGVIVYDKPTVRKAIELFRALYTFFPDDLSYGLALARVQTLGGRSQEAARLRL